MTALLALAVTPWCLASLTGCALVVGPQLAWQAIR